MNDTEFAIKIDSVLEKLDTAEQALRRSQHFLQSTLDSLPSHIAILDHTGTIVAVNAAWRAFAEANSYADPDAGIGVSYLQVCDQASGDRADQASLVACGLREIIAGRRERFDLEYPCHSPGEQRWFCLSMSRFTSDGQVYIVAAHLDISERKSIDLKLQEQHMLLQTVIESIPDAVYMKDLQGRYLYMNSRGASIIGKPRADVIGHDDTTLFAPATASRIMEHDRQILIIDEPMAFESTRAIDDTLRYYRTTKAIWRDAQGQVGGVIGTSYDITERRLAEQARDESQRRLQALFDNAQDAILLADDRGRFVDANPAACALLGYSRDELLHLTFRDLVFERDRENVEQIWCALLADGRYSGEHAIVRKDGSMAEIEYRAVANFVPGMHLGIIHDITERKQAQMARQYLAAIVETSHDAIIGKTLDGIIHSWNVGAERIYGYTAAEILGRSIAVIVPPDRPNDLSEIFETLQRGESIIDYETVRVRKDGTRIHVSLTISPIRDLSGAILGASTIARDSTERKRAEEALQLYAERLKMYHQIDRAILAAHSPVEVAQAALSHLKQLVPYTHGGLLVTGSQGNQTTALAVDSSGELAGGARSYMVLPLISQGAQIGALCLGVGQADAFTPAHVDIAREVANSVAIALQQARLREQIGSGREQLRSLTRRLVETQETERRQLAQELHDQVGQTLTALNISLRIVRDQLAPDALARVGSRLDEAARLAEEAMIRIRDVMAALRPAVLDDYGLAAALDWYVQQFSERMGMDVALHLHPSTNELRLEPEVETALFRMVQEALTNVVKHARVTCATVTLEADAQGLRLIVADQGIGFEPAEPARVSEQLSLGLVGMRERVEAVGGSLRLESAPGQGTRVVAEVKR